MCKTPGCFAPPSGKSAYCTVCKPLARAAWKAKVAEDAAARDERNARWAELARKAREAGEAALAAATPTPMIVEQRIDPLDDESRVTKQWYVPQGACGFAWVTIRPGNSSFAIWAKNNLGARKAYRGGVEIWVHQGDQSVELKEAYARAFAQVLREAGIKAYAQSRLD